MRRIKRSWSWSSNWKCGTNCSRGKNQSRQMKDSKDLKKMMLERSDIVEHPHVSHSENIQIVTAKIFIRKVRLRAVRVAKTKRKSTLMDTIFQFIYTFLCSSSSSIPSCCWYCDKILNVEIKSIDSRFFLPFVCWS